MTSQTSFSQSLSTADVYTNSSDLVIDALQALGDSGNTQFGPLLIEILQTTENPLIRNAAAIGLSDLGDERALYPIVQLLKDPKTIGYRGTLIYALEAFNCVPILDDLVDLVIQGDFEVSHQAFSVIEGLEAVAHESLQQAIQTIQNSLETVNHDKKELLADLITLLNEIDAELSPVH
jgi:HEAT repeat protein